MYYKLYIYSKYYFLQNYRTTYHGVSTFLKNKLKFLEYDEFLSISKIVVLASYFLSLMMYIITLALGIAFKNNQYFVYTYGSILIAFTLQFLLNKEYLMKLSEFNFIKKGRIKIPIILVWWVSDSFVLKLYVMSLSLLLIVSNHLVGFWGLILLIISALIFINRIEGLTKFISVANVSYRELTYEVSIRRGDRYIKSNLFIIIMFEIILTLVCLLVDFCVNNQYAIQILFGLIAVIIPAEVVFISSFIRENDTLTKDFWTIRYYARKLKVDTSPSVFKYLILNYATSLILTLLNIFFYGFISMGLIDSILITTMASLAILITARILSYRINNAALYSVEEVKTMREFLTTNYLEDTFLLGLYTIAYPSLLAISIKYNSKFVLMTSFCVFILMLLGRLYIAYSSKKRF
jgi:hypothetical protein